MQNPLKIYSWLANLSFYEVCVKNPRESKWMHVLHSLSLANVGHEAAASSDKHASSLGMFAVFARRRQSPIRAVAGISWLAKRVEWWVDSTSNNPPIYRN